MTVTSPRTLTTTPAATTSEDDAGAVPASCPKCGYDLHLPTTYEDTQAALLASQKQISDLQAQVKLLNAKASAAIDRWADYEDELARLRAELDDTSSGASSSDASESSDDDDDDHSSEDESSRPQSRSQPANGASAAPAVSTPPPPSAARQQQQQQRQPTLQQQKQQQQQKQISTMPLPTPPSSVAPATPSPSRTSFLASMATTSAATRISAYLSSRKSTPNLKPLPTLPQHLHHQQNRSIGSNGSALSPIPSLPSSYNPTSPPPSVSSSAMLSTEDLLEALSREQARRVEAEGRLNETSKEVEELSVSLFEQANEMVASERRARAQLEQRIEMLEKRDMDKRRRLDTLERSMGRIDRVRAVLQESAGAM